MKQSLREQLNDWIRKEGEVSYEAVKTACETGKFKKYYRIETADRRLRPSESPNVEPVLKNGYIVKWRWIGAPIKYQIYRVLNNDGSVEREIKVAI